MEDDDLLDVGDDDFDLAGDDGYAGSIRERAAQLRSRYEGGDIADLAFEIQARRLPGDHPSDEAKRIVDSLLDLLPAGHFNCRMHERCNLEPTDRKVKTRLIREQVMLGNAEWDPDEELFTWTDEGWPEWRRRCVPLRAGDGEGGE